MERELNFKQILTKISKIEKKMTISLQIVTYSGYKML